MSKTSREHKASAPKKVKFAVFTCSTSRYRTQSLGGKAEDPSGDLIVDLLKAKGHEVTRRSIIPDDKEFIEKAVEEALSSEDVDAIITCGGTGISKTDVTIETMRTFLEKELEGFGEILRRISYDEIGSAAVLTRATAGVCRGKVIFSIPGSPQAVRVALEKLILNEVGHILKHAREGTD